MPTPTRMQFEEVSLYFPTDEFEFRFWFFAGRNAMAKLETRIRELETELGSVQARMINLKPSYLYFICS